MITISYIPPQHLDVADNYLSQITRDYSEVFDT